MRKYIQKIWLGILLALMNPSMASAQQILPECAKTGNCRDVDAFIQLFINFATFAVIGISGTFALLFFVYGGFMMILSAGNSERVTKGKDILVNSIIGLALVFTAYLIVLTLLKVLGVETEGNSNYSIRIKKL